jgi:hypothetical protein
MAQHMRQALAMLRQAWALLAVLLMQKVMLAGTSR